MFFLSYRLIRLTPKNENHIKLLHLWEDNTDVRVYKKNLKSQLYINNFILKSLMFGVELRDSTRMLISCYPQKHSLNMKNYLIWLKFHLI